MANDMIFSMEGLGSGKAHRFKSNQHSSSCSARSSVVINPIFSAAYELDSIP